MKHFCIFQNEKKFSEKVALFHILKNLFNVWLNARQLPPELLQHIQSFAIYFFI